MIVVLSPSKTLECSSSPIPLRQHTTPAFLAESTKLIEILREKTPEEIAKLMTISANLALLNYKRYQDFHVPFTIQNSRPAIFSFKGDVYEGIEIEGYSEGDLKFAQAHLRILSGLYGLLRPLDLMQPYRLEMGIKLRNSRGKDLYQFWGDKITQALNFALREQSTDILLNLASQEYFKAVQESKLNGKIVNVIFKENKGGELRVIGLFAKRARGKMVNFIIKNHIKSAQDITKFTESGYRFDAALSDDKNYVFIR